MKPKLTSERDICLSPGRRDNPIALLHMQRPSRAVPHQAGLVAFGFSGDSTFVRAFRRRFGLTPGEARQHLANKRRHDLGNGIPDSVIPIKTLADR
jgi:hypothetical protein